MIDEKTLNKYEKELAKVKQSEVPTQEYIQVINTFPDMKIIGSAFGSIIFTSQNQIYAITEGPSYGGAQKCCIELRRLETREQVFLPQEEKPTKKKVASSYSKNKFGGLKW